MDPYSSLLNDCRSMLNRFQYFTKLELAIFITKQINVQIIKRGCAQQEDSVILEELPSIDVSNFVSFDASGVHS